MKKLFICAIAVAMFTACTQKSESKIDGQVAQNVPEGKGVLAADAPKVKFEKEVYDFHVIDAGQKVSYTFKFKNEGKTPLIITDATATCGCTTPDFTKTPVKPGEEGAISVVFDSTGKNGIQDKVITITSNANPEANKLHLVGEVKVKG
jgi:hypothetical protein